MEETQNFLQDVEQELNLEPASKGARFANYIIDILAFYALVFVIGFIYGAILLSGATTMDGTELDEGNAGAATLMIYVIAFGLVIGYYTVMEATTNGRTIGKFVTGTQALQKDGSRITWQKAFVRSLVRLVPLEPLVALFTEPWHDSWTNTVVVKKR